AYKQLNNMMRSSQLHTPVVQNCRLNASDILRDCCCCRPAGAWRITKVNASLLEECAPPGDIATVHTIIPIHATHVDD
ncbi:hypothetical protein L9F63_025299, partial [Diploptera punctata]